MLEDNFTDIIKKASTGQGMGIYAVATASGLAMPVLRELETGQRPPTRAEVLALADALHLDGTKLAGIACDRWHPRHPIPTTVHNVLTIHGDIGGYAVNGYVFYDPITREAVTIDTGYNPVAVLQAVQRERLRLTAICLTHGHADHAVGIDAILARHQVPVYIGESDWGLLQWKPPTDLRKFIGDGETIPVGEKEIRFVKTPGHTPGGVCYLTNDSCFVGDTLFAGSIGRANPSALYSTHLESVRKHLLTLPDHFILFPGHGPATTAREEKEHNPFG